jgi:uncharacterized protein
MSRLLCIYHGNCADGFTSAWVVSKAVPSAEFHEGHYGSPPPDCAGRDVLMVDFSYKRPVLLTMAEQAKSIVIIDHHKSAQADLVDLPPNVKTVFDMDRSGARMTWDYFLDMGGNAPGLLIQHVEDRDLWRFKNKNTRTFQANLFSYEYTFANWDAIDKICSDTMEYQQFIAEGAAIERKHFKDVKELIAAAAMRGVIGGVDVPVLNAPYFYSSDAGHIMAQGEPFAACYWDTPKGRVYSLRSSDEGLDVSEIAVSYGGGGHRNAAGFTLPVGETL